MRKGHYYFTIVAKILYVCKRTRQNIQTTVAFLCRRVKSPDEDSYKKLVRVMQYLVDNIKD